MNINKCLLVLVQKMSFFLLIQKACKKALKINKIKEII